MAEVKVNDEDIRRLEYIASEAYDSFCQGVKTHDDNAIEMARRTFQSNLDARLRTIIRPTQMTQTLRKKGKRAKGLDRFILQIMLMSDNLSTAHDEDLLEIEITEDLNDKMAGLKAYIDAEEPEIEYIIKAGKKVLGVVYRKLQEKAMKVRQERDYQAIANALTYIRENYPAQNL